MSCRKSAAAAETNGTACEVPDIGTSPQVLLKAADMMKSPGATSSGLMRPSSVGPYELYIVRRPYWSAPRIGKLTLVLSSESRTSTAGIVIV